MNTVLFVDNESSVLLALQREFRGFEAHTLYCSSGDEALEILSREHVGVIVSDNKMPGMNGLDLLALTKYRFPDTSRIMLTGYADLNYALAAINHCDIFRFIIKPWDRSELRKAIVDGLELNRLTSALKSGDDAIYSSLVHVVELRDPYTRGHCDRVSELSLMLARSLGCEEPLLTHIRNGSILHDCGKIGVSENILNCSSKLSFEEYESIKIHPVAGYEIARKAGLPREVLNIILYHHEQYSGSGYPHRLAGEAIPLEARIVAIADVYDALTSSRPYRASLSHDEAMAEMDKMAFIHFDPLLMETFRLNIGDGM